MDAVAVYVQWPSVRYLGSCQRVACPDRAAQSLSGWEAVGDEASVFCADVEQGEGGGWLGRR